MSTGYLSAMSRAHEIKAAIDSLSPAERDELDRLLDLTATASKKTSLPDYAARRRRIFGDRVLLNPVLEARKLEWT
jgi:hypothetical protein